MAGPGQQSFSTTLPTTHAQRPGGPASTGSRPPPEAPLTSIYGWFQETLLKMSKQEWRTFLGFRAWRKWILGGNTLTPCPASPLTFGPFLSTSAPCAVRAPAPSLAATSWPSSYKSASICAAPWTRCWRGTGEQAGAGPPPPPGRTRAR